MSREFEFKPGDVASILLRGCQPAFRTDKGWVYVDGSTQGIDGDGYGFRPLAVIDPDSREDVERLAAACRDVSGEAALTDEPWSIPGLRMQAALREFANPQPDKPDEPTGLGAVVEDADGVPWVRCEDADLEPHWYARNKRRDRYADIDAVHVLSEGVSDD